MTTVVVADDEPLVRAGIAMLLEVAPDLHVVGEASNGLEAVELVRALHPDVVVMDLRMPVLDGVAATERILAEEQSRRDGRLTRVLTVTTFDEDDAIHGALRAGASGFLLKQAAPEDLTAAVRRIAEGEAWLDPRIARKVINALTLLPTAVLHAGDALERLTPREREVLELMAYGLSNNEISDRLVLSEATVKTHVARVLMKSGCRDRTQAVVLAYQSGLVKAGSTLEAKGSRSQSAG